MNEKDKSFYTVNSGRKGASVLISAVLLIALVFSIAVVFTDFLPNLVQGLTDSTSEDTDKLLESSDYRIQIDSAQYDDARNQVEVSIKNSGNKIDGNITITAFCGSEAYQKQISNVSAGEVTLANIDGIGCEVDNVRASMNEYPVSDEEDNLEVVGESSLNYKSGADFEDAVKDAISVVYAPLKLSKNLVNEEESNTFSGAKQNTTVENGVLQLAKE